jgi:hypothetical protein
MIDAVLNVAVFAALALCIVASGAWAHRRSSVTLIKSARIACPSARTSTKKIVLAVMVRLAETGPRRACTLRCGSPSFVACHEAQ